MWLINCTFTLQDAVFKNAYLSLVPFALMGGFLTMFNIQFTIVQKSVDSEYVGRVILCYFHNCHSLYASRIDCVWLYLKSGQSACDAEFVASVSSFSVVLIQTADDRQIIMKK